MAAVVSPAHPPHTHTLHVDNLAWPRHRGRIGAKWNSQPTAGPRRHTTAIELDSGEVIADIDPDPSNPNFAYEDADGAEPALLTQPAPQLVERIAYDSFCVDHEKELQGRSTQAAPPPHGSTREKWAGLSADRRHRYLIIFPAAYVTSAHTQLSCR
jgi:hypothetical protein